VRFQINNDIPPGPSWCGTWAACCQGIFNDGGVYHLFPAYPKDIFKYMVCKLDEKLKQNLRVTRASAVRKLDIARKKPGAGRNYLDSNSV